MPIVECIAGYADPYVGGHQYNFERDRFGRFTAVVENPSDLACLLSVTHYRIAEDLTVDALPVDPGPDPEALASAPGLFTGAMVDLTQQPASTIPDSPGTPAGTDPTKPAGGEGASDQTARPSPQVDGAGDGLEGEGDTGEGDPQGTAKDLTIAEAVLLLDPADDAHWTREGQPAVQVIGAMVGRVGTLTRAEVDAAAPGFVRPEANSAE